MKNKEYIISPSALSYLCNHCQYLMQNHELVNKGISAGITQTLDGIEKEYFLGDCRKIDKNLPKGETIDPFNNYFFSKILTDKDGRIYRLKGKADAIIKFDDGEYGIIDYKTSKFKANPNKKDYFKEKNLQEKIDEYNPQLHAYYLLYSNLETNEDFLRKQYQKSYPTSKEPKITIGVNKVLDKIKRITISKPKIFGLVFIYPEDTDLKKSIKVNFSFKFCKVPIDLEGFKNKMTNYMKMLHNKTPPLPPKKCGCFMHKYFYDPKKLKY